MGVEADGENNLWYEVSWKLQVEKKPDKNGFGHGEGDDLG